MENKRIVISDRKAALFLLVFGIVFAVGLSTFIFINDLVSDNEHIWGNLGAMGIIGGAMLLITGVPALIISRYKVVLDYQNEEITYVHYFKPKKVFRFDEIKLTHQLSKTRLPTYDYVFSSGGKVIFKLSDLDFVTSTKESEEYLHRLFTGTEKVNYEWEKKYNGIKGLYANVIDYSSEYPGKFIRIDLREQSYFIEMESDMAQGCYHITVSERRADAKRNMIVTAIEKLRCSFDKVNVACDSLIEKYTKV